jgi:hypothetical protein
MGCRIAEYRACRCRRRVRWTIGLPNPLIDEYLLSAPTTKPVVPPDSVVSNFRESWSRIVVTAGGRSAEKAVEEFHIIAPLL